MTPTEQAIIKEAVSRMADLIGHADFVAVHFDIHYACLKECKTAMKELSRLSKVSKT